jgi:hypothetical protein
VRDAFHLQVLSAGAAIIQKEHGAVSAGEELLQLQDLPPLAQRSVREHAHLGKGIEDNAYGIHPFHFRD